MSGVDGVPVWQDSQWEYFSDLQTDEPASHVAFTKPVAAALVDVAEAVQREDGWKLSRAMRALDAARAQETP